MKNIVPNKWAHNSAFNPKKRQTAKGFESLEAYYKTSESKDDLITDENEADFQHIKLSIKEAVDRKIDQYNARETSILPTGNMVMLPILPLIIISN